MKFDWKWLCAVFVTSVLAFAGASKMQASLFQLLNFPVTQLPIALTILGMLEIIFAFLMLANYQCRQVWAISFYLFLLLSAYTLIRPASEHCGCFGNFEVGPRSLFFLNLVVTAGSGYVGLFGNFKNQSFWTHVRLKHLLAPCVLTLFISMMSVLGVDQRLSTQRLHAHPTAASALAVSIDDKSFVFIGELYNLNKVDVSLLGWKPGCGFKPLIDEPVVIPPGGSVKIPFVAKYGQASVHAKIRVECYLDIGGKLVQSPIFLEVNLREFEPFLANVQT